MDLDYSMEHPPLTQSWNPIYPPVAPSIYERTHPSSIDLPNPFHASAHQQVHHSVQEGIPNQRQMHHSVQDKIPYEYYHPTLSSNQSGINDLYTDPSVCESYRSSSSSSSSSPSEHLYPSVPPPANTIPTTSGVQCLWETPHNNICSTWHRNPDDLAAHIISFHIPTQESVVCHWKGCDREGKPCKRKSQLLNHLRVHTGETPFKCDVCQKRFARAANLKIHGRTHTGEKPFLCKVEGCLKRFSESTVRIKHMRTHVERTQFFECKQCDKKYGHLDALKKHIKNKHRAEAPGTSASGAILTDTSNVRQGPALDEQSSSNTPSYSQVDYSGFYKHREHIYIYPDNNYEY